MRGDPPLFYENNLDDFIRSKDREIHAAVNGIERDQFLGSSDEQIANHVESSFAIEPLTLHEDRMTASQKETKVDVSGDRDRAWYRDRSDGPLMIPGVAVTVRVPYTGATGLWRMKSNPWRTSFPRGEVLPAAAGRLGEFVITVALPSDADPNSLKQHIDSTLSDVRFYIENQRKQLETWNGQLRATAAAAAHARRQKLEQNQSFMKVLNIPLERREGAPSVEPIKVQQRLVRPLPPPPRGGVQQYGIEAKVSDHVLAVIRHEGRSMEGAPATFNKFEEEELRDVLLAHLNGHYRGQATAEAFRKRGKTDIRIEHDNRAAFVGECKVWHGVKEFAAAIDQLGGYLTWRDSRAALIVYNKGVAAFSDVTARIGEALSGHTRLVSLEGEAEPGEWSAVIRSAEDDGHHIQLRVFAFNLHVTKPKK